MTGSIRRVRPQAKHQQREFPAQSIHFGQSPYQILANTKQRISSSAPLPTEPTSENPWTGLSTIGYGTPASTNIDPYYPVPAPPSSRKSEVEIVTVTSTPLASCYQPTIVEISTETELPTPVSTLIRTRPVTITTVTTTAYSTILAVDEEDEEPTSTKSSCVSGKHDIACRAGFTVDASQVL